MTSKAKRDQFAALKAAGVSNKDVIKQLNVCRKMVFNTWKRYITSKPIPSRKRTIRTTRIVKAL